jgi:hypothetical protein
MAHEEEDSIFVSIYRDYMRKQVARLTPTSPELGWEGEVLLETLALEPIPALGIGGRPGG